MEKVTAAPRSFWAEQGPILSLVASRAKGLRGCGEAAIVPTSGNFFLSPAWPGPLGDASCLQLDVLTAPSAGGLVEYSPPAAHTTDEIFGDMLSRRPIPWRACLRVTARAFKDEAAFLGDQQQMELIVNLKEQQTALFLFLPLPPATAPGCPITLGCHYLWGLVTRSSLRNLLPLLAWPNFPMLRGRAKTPAGPRKTHRPA